MSELWDNRDKTKVSKPLTVWTEDLSGAYQCETPGKLAKRYTAFVKFVWPDAEGPDDYTLEEIDINARSEPQAFRVAEAALAKDYEPGGKIIRMTERIGWYM
jgi:hypothetical protein